MATTDMLLKLMFSWIDLREGCAEQLKKLEKHNARESHRPISSSYKLLAGTATLLWSTATNLGGTAAAALLGGAKAGTAATALLGGAGTAAAVLPYVIPLGAAYAVYKGVGVAIPVVTKVTQQFSNMTPNNAMKKAEKIEMESNDIAQRIQKLFDRLKAEIKKVSPSADQDEVDRLVMTELLGAIARQSGLKMKIDFSKLCDEQQDFFEGVGKNQSPINVMTIGLASILTCFAYKTSGKRYKGLFAKGAVEMKERAGLEDLMVGVTARKILQMTETLRRLFNSIKEMLQRLAKVKQCIENGNRTNKDQKELIEFAMKECQDPDVKDWLRGNISSLAFFHLVNMFNYLKKELDKKKEKTDRQEIDIIFVAHGEIDGSMMSARTLVPLPTITDVLLYSPWNCLINGGVAYGIATGSIEPWHRMFVCAKRGCPIPTNRHQPNRSTFNWNSMRAATGLIPKISVRPITSPEDGAWKHFMFLQIQHGQPERNRIVIPFIVPKMFSLKIPFFVVTLALSLVLIFSRYRATVHLAACLGRDEKTVLEPEILEQYAYTIDNTLMMTSQESNVDNLYRAMKDLFG